MWQAVWIKAINADMVAPPTQRKYLSRREKLKKTMEYEDKGEIITQSQNILISFISSRE